MFCTMQDSVLGKIVQDPSGFGPLWLWDIRGLRSGGHMAHCCEPVWLSLTCGGKVPPILCSDGNRTNCKGDF